MTSAAITFTPAEVARYYAARVPELKQRRAIEWRGPCPVHHGSDDNFAVQADTGLDYCHSQCGRGWDIISLEQELTGADFRTAKAEVFRLIGRDDSNGDRQAPHIVAEYFYTDETGELLYQVVRFEPKSFKQRRPDGTGWIWNVRGVRQVPYHLVELIEAPIVFIAEGEKDCDVVRDFGFCATCNSGGAGKWRPEFNQLFSGKEVCILPDADPPGWRHALDIARGLVGIAAKIQILELPGAKDPADWFEQGHSELELIELVEAPCHQ